MPAHILEVAATVLQGTDGRVLLAERTAGQLSPGYWELPGGKVDPGETAVQAARRELSEEIGIRATELRPWLVYEHRFPLRRIRLHLFRATAWEGTPRGCEGQRLGWFDPARPGVTPILPSCERALAALALPPLYAVLDNDDVCAERLREAIGAGAQLIQIHPHALAPEQRSSLARQLNAIATAQGARILLHGSPQEARRAGITGLHSEARELRRMTARPPVRLWIPVCHDAEDLTRATALGADAVIVAPVLGGGLTAAHPALGWEGLARLVAGTGIGVYAGGGMTSAAIAQARAAGAIGVATDRWNPDPDRRH